MHRFALPWFFFIMLSACSEEHKAIVDLGTASTCDVAEKACTIQRGKLSLILQLGPNVKPLQSFNAKLKYTGNNGAPKTVVIDFRMVGMDMGLNRYRLMQRDDGWEGKVTLPVCTASRTDWLAVVEITEGNQQYIANFPFHTDMN